MVTREPEWDDASRGRAMRLFEHERSIDQATGLPLDVAYDDKQPFIVRHATNYAVKAREKVRSDHAELPENKDKPGWDTGRTYFVEVPDLPPRTERTPS